MTTRTNLRIVSFDGGGVRGLSQLEIMENIMHHLNWEKQLKASPPSLPCEYFDLMGGSGTGGLIAIMLARLHMTVEEVSEEFCTIAEEVYQQTDITPSDRTQRLKQCMENLMTRRMLPIDMKLLDEAQTGGCVCFVVTSLRINARTKLCLRSYPVRNHLASSITVVEAVLATCATQPDFAPVTIGLRHKRKDYIGAGLGSNNPINEVIVEAHSLYGGDATVVSLLSVGSGHPGIITLPSHTGVDLSGTMRDIMNDCTERAREIEQKIGRTGIYYRFSVEHGMQTDHLSQAMDLDWIVTQTESYIEEHVQQLEAFAKNNSSQMNVATLDQLKSGNAQFMLPANLDLMNVGDAGPNNEVVILAKLKPLDLDCGPAVRECMEGTRQDILVSILNWASDFHAPNIFWVKGHPGVGKSAISVTLTEGLRKSKQLGSSFFFQRERANALTPNTLWRVIAYDLARKYPTIRKRMLIALATNEALITTLNTELLFRELIQEPLMTCGDISDQNPPIIVIDALDECGGLDGQHSEHRTNLRRTLKQWSNLPKMLKLAVTSRGEADLEELFSTIEHIPLEIHAGTTASLHSLEDIKKILEHQFRQIVNRYQNELSADWPGPQIIHELTLRSGGLFIWVKTAMEFLNQGDPEEQLSQILAGTGAGGMATLYSWILKTAFPHPSERVIKAFHAFVGAVILSKEPLPASSILEL